MIGGDSVACMTFTTKQKRLIRIGLHCTRENSARNLRVMHALGTDDSAFADGLRRRIDEIDELLEQLQKEETS